MTGTVKIATVGVVSGLPPNPGVEARSTWLSVLGAFSLKNAEGREISVKTKRNRVLLAFLALSRGRSATRERIATLLWGSRGEAEARSNLRQSLAVLRKELGTEVHLIQTQDEMVGLHPQAFRVDALEVLACADLEDISRLRQAAGYCRGEFLADISLAEETIEEWLSSERSRLRAAEIRLFERLSQLETGPSRIEAARALVQLDPLRESSHRLLMRAYAEQGDNGQALKQYDMCRTVLHDELQAEPAQKTQELRREIAQGSFKARDHGKKESIETAERDAEPPKSVTSAEELPIPFKPSVAVLPFSNLSGDPEQDYFSDGMTVDLITELARSQNLLVIARNSSFVFRGRAVNVTDVGKKLGVRYVVEGSVRRAGTRLRITAQLIEASTGNHVWAERYDRNLEDLFAVQDEVAERIAWALVGKVGAAEIVRTRQTQTRLDAYDAFLRGVEAFHRFTETDTVAAIEFFKLALSSEPESARTQAWLANVYATLSGWKSDEVLRALALESALQAIQLGDASGLAEAVMAALYAWKRDFEAAEIHWQRALMLGPTNPTVLAWVGYICLWNGRLIQAREIGERLKRLSPLEHREVHELLAFAYYLLGDYEASLSSFRRWDNNNYDRGFANLAACLGQLGRIDEAKLAWGRYLELRPGYTLDDYKRGSPYHRQEDVEHWIDGLQKAGLAK